MHTREILASHPITTLRKEIAKTNIKGYSKMKKAEVIDLMMKDGNKDKFHHIKMAEPKERKAPAKKEKKSKKEKVLAYEKAWAENNFNSSQRLMIAKMTDERRKEVLDILGLKKQKAPAKSKDVPLKKVTKEDIAELGRGKKKKKVKRKPPLKNYKPPLTATKQDGTVVELKRKKPKKK